MKKGAEATSEAQDNVPLPAALPEALGAGCAMNRFFNKLLEQISDRCTRSQSLPRGFSVRKSLTSLISMGHSNRKSALFGEDGLERGGGDVDIPLRTVGIRDVLLKHAMRIEEGAV